MRMHGAGDQRRGGISRREGGREGGGQRKEAKGVIVNFTWRHATRGSRALSFPPSLLPSFLPSFLPIPHMMSPITPSRRPANSYHYSRRAAAAAAAAAVGGTKREGSRKTIIYLSKLPNRGKTRSLRRLRRSERSARKGKGNKNDR